MNLDCETILDVYTHKNRKFLCQIKVNPKIGAFKSCRRLSAEQWNTFDQELEKLISTIDDWNNEKCLKFIISPRLLVRVQKSKLSFKRFYKYFGTFVDYDISSDKELFADVVEANFVLECVFEFQLDGPLSSQKCESDNKASLDSNSHSPMPYLKCSPFKKKYRTKEIDTVKTPGNETEYDENTYSPQPVSDIVTIKPKCKPAKINACRISRNRSGSSGSNFHKEVLAKKDDIVPTKRDKFLQITSSKMSKRKKIQEHCVIVNEREQEKDDKTEKIRKREERSKSEDVFLELFDENSKEHVSKKEQIRDKEKHTHFDSKIKRNRSRTLDEMPVEFSFISEKKETKNKMEESTEKSDKILDRVTKISTHKFKENANKNCFAIKEIDPENSLSQNETKTLTQKSKNPLNTPQKKIILQGSNENNSNLNETLLSPTAYSLDTFPQEIIRIEMKPKASSEKALKPLRRSERPPNKPKRFVEEQHDLVYNKKHKSSFKCKELFGTDDDDDGDYFQNNNDGKINIGNKIQVSVFETPVSKKSAHCSSSSSSKNKKRKRDKIRECEQEKHNMSKWLSKKKLVPLNKEVIKSSKSTTTLLSSRALPLKSSTKIKSEKDDGDSETPLEPAASSLISLELPSKEELELMRNKSKLMQKENAKVRAELDKMRTSPPKEVEILSLQSIPVDVILDSFSTYRSELDEIYKNNRKRDYIKGHDGINHCFVIRLLEQNIQMKMLEKLTEAYSNQETTTQATLFANALLPEWVIRVFMQKFHFTRQQAIDQVKAQEEFQLHIEEQSDNTFEFD